MDKKSTVVWMLVFFVLVVAWGQVSPKILKQLGYSTTQPAATQLASGPTTIPVLAPTTVPTLPVDAAGTPATQVAASTGGWAVLPPTNATAHTLGSLVKDQTWAIGIDISPKGAGLDRAVINEYKLSQHSETPFTYETPGSLFPEQTRTLAVRQVVIDEQPVDITGATWSFVGETSDNDSQSLTYELTLAKQGTPALTLQRTYTVYKRSAVLAKVGDIEYSPLGYEIRAVNTFKNLTSAPLKVQLRFNGPSVPLTEAERGPDAYYIVARAPKGVVSTIAWSVDSIKPAGDDLLEKAKQRDGQPYWIASTTTYFLSILRFEPLANQTAPVDWIESADAKALTPTLYGRNREVELLITAKPTTIAAGATSEIASRLYLGPKKREVLTNSHYSAPWIQFDQSLVITQGICGICTWQWLVNILFFILKSFHYITHDWGLAIIGLVILVRILLHPISKKAQLNMLKFGKLAPEMERIKKKYADDQPAMQREMMRFYKENGSTQLMGCLPMFLQMPVWIALWQAMNTTFELRHQPFFYNLTWIKDLSKPDHLIDFGQSYHLPLLSFVVISGINVLPFLFGALQYIQFKIQPKPPTMTPEQEQQQKMTQWMMLIMMPVLLYASPSGLMIYMITSFLLGIAESKIVKKQFEQMTKDEERFTFVEGETPAVQKPAVRRKDAPKKGGLFGMLEEFREKAMNAQREMEKNRRKPK
jgi:YidC/Oxa1 family membrane protein insertase